MKFSKNKIYICQLCNKKYTSTLHEIWGGNLYRKLSIKYNFQVPLCVECHQKAHQEKEFYQVYFCSKLDINFQAARLAFNTKSIYWLDAQKKKLEIKLNNMLV